MAAICVFGDSLSRGVVLDEAKKRYIFSKNSFIDLFHKVTNIDVDNYAKFGCTITKGESILEKHLANIGEYAETVLEFGGNDCDFDWTAISNDPNGQYLPKTPLDVFEKTYAKMIELVRSYHSRPVMLSLPPIDAERYFNQITAGRNAENILQWLGDTQRIYRHHEMYNISIAKIAMQYQVPLIDIRSSFLATKNYKNLICSDGIHPNESGHALIFKEICDYLKIF